MNEKLWYDNDTLLGRNKRAKSEIVFRQKQSQIVRSPFLEETHTQHGKLVFAAASASTIAQHKPVQLLQATMATPPPRVIYKPKGPPGGLRKKGWSAKSLLIPGLVFGLLVLAYSVLNSMLVCIFTVDSHAQVIPDAFSVAGPLLHL